MNHTIKANTELCRKAVESVIINNKGPVRDMLLITIGQYYDQKVGK